MRVISWNIQYGIESELAAMEIAGSEQMRNFDLLLLQEMDEPGTQTIAEALQANYAYSTAGPHANTGRDFGNAVVTKWPIRRSAEVPLPHKASVNGQPRSATNAVVRVGDHDVSAYSVHTEIPSLRLARRIEQFAMVAADADWHPFDLAVVGGDFNTVTARGVQALVDTMKAAGLDRVSSATEPSYRRGGRDLILDHVFATGFEHVASGVVTGTTASDHAPLWVELQVPDTPPLDDGPPGSDVRRRDIVTAISDDRPEEMR